MRNSLRIRTIDGGVTDVTVENEEKARLRFSYFREICVMSDPGGYGVYRRDYPKISACGKWSVSSEVGEPYVTVYMRAINMQLADVEERFPGGIGVKYQIQVNHKHSGPYWKIEIEHN